MGGRRFIPRVGGLVITAVGVFAALSPGGVARAAVDTLEGASPPKVCPRFIAGDGASLMDVRPGRFERFALAPVLEEGGRSELARIVRGADGTSLTVTSPVGTYQFRITDDPAEAYPGSGLPEVRVSRGRVHARLVIPARDLGDDLLRVQGLVRSAFRADPYLHPHLRPPVADRRAVLSLPQREALAALIGMEERRGRKRGLLMPVGTGKTVVAAKYVAALGDLRRERHSRGWKKPPKVLFVVENTHVLDRSVETFERELGFTRMARIYGERRDHFQRDAEMVAVTRSSYFGRRELIHEMLIADPDQPWVIVFDEAHHLGKTDGQFEAITADLDEITDHRHRELDLSPFYYHRDRFLIRERLEGNVYGAFLDEAEQRQLRRGRHIVDLARAQYYRGMQRGYLSPIFRLTLIRQVGGAPAIDLLNPQAPEESGTRRVRWHQSLLDDIARRTLASRVRGVSDRGVFFVDTRARADLYAKKLAALLGEDVRPLHSGEDVDPDTYGWFADRGAYDNAEGRRKHKYVVVVDMLREGVDIPAINLAVLLRRYGSDLAGFGSLLQNLGRGSRVHGLPPQFKTSLRVLDYTLYTRWLRDGLSAISIEPDPDHRDRGDPPGPTVLVDEELLDPVEFERRYLSLFPQDATWVDQHPFFDLRLFVAEAVPELYRQSIALGIPDWSHGSAPMRLAIRLAEALPRTPEREELLSRLRDRETWGWKKHDGAQLGQGIALPCRRMYEALFEIAALLKLTPAGESLDLATLHQGAGLRDLLDRLVPAARPLHGEAIVRFLDPVRGALALLLREETQRLDSRARNSRALFLALARRLPPSEDRDRLIADLEADRLGLDPEDGNRDLALTSEQTRQLAANMESVRWSYNRVFSVWRRLATLWNAAHPETPVNLARLHERRAAERFLDLLMPYRRRAGPLEGARYNTFVDEESGGLAVLRARIANFGQTKFVQDFGPRRLVLALLARMGGDEAEALRRELLDPQLTHWGPNDGIFVAQARPNVIRRLYAALWRVADLWHRSTTGSRVRADAIHTRRGMETFLDEVFLGFVLPPLTPALVTRMSHESTGVIASLLAIKNARAIERYHKDFGVKRLMVSLAGLLGDSPAEAGLKQLLDGPRWDWKPQDAEMVKRGEPTAVYRLYRAFAAIAYLARTLHGCPVTVEETTTGAGARRLIEFLERLRP